MAAQFSIITCTWNSEPWLAASIASVLMQDNSDFEYIFVDGGSSDGTLERIRALPRPYRLLEGVRGGIARAMNAGLEAASGHIVAHLHSDDYYLGPDVLSTVARHMEGGAGWLFGRIMDDVDGRLIAENFQAPRFSYARLVRGNFIPHPATFVRRELMLRAGGFDEKLKYAMDYDLWLRLARLQPPLQLDRALAAFRVHGGSLSSRERTAAMEEDLRVRLAHAGRNRFQALLHRLRFHVRRRRVQQAMGE